MRTWSLLVLLALPAWAGCLIDSEDCSDAPLDVLAPVLPTGALVTDPGQAWDTVLLWNHSADDPFTNVHFQATTPPGWNLEAETFSEEDGVAGQEGDADDAGPSDADQDAGPIFRRLRMTPGPTPVGGAFTVIWEGRTGTNCPVVSGSYSYDLSAPTAGEAGLPGDGVLVYTAGFWENGTLFYTNIPEMHAMHWPRADWYAWGGGDPLPVRIYQEDSNEGALLWDPSGQVDTSGTPLEGQPWAYFATIPGFNDALKGLSSHTVRVVHLEPEEAYTRTGNEDHPLYGDALVFLLWVERVDRAPCPTAGPEEVCPLLPDVPGAPSGISAGRGAWTAAG